jgi:hypothetical protein
MSEVPHAHDPFPTQPPPHSGPSPTSPDQSQYTYTYDLANRLSTEMLNGTAAGTYSYDVTNQLTSDGTNNWSYDKNGNRNMTGYQTGGDNEITNDGTWTYTYDSEGDLTKKTKGASAETWYYGYDDRNHGQDWKT